MTARGGDVGLTLGLRKGPRVGDLVRHGRSLRRRLRGANLTIRAQGAVIQALKGEKVRTNRGGGLEPIERLEDSVRELRAVLTASEDDNDNLRTNLRLAEDEKRLALLDLHRLEASLTRRVG
jgi:hypothetical protein